MSQQQTNQEHQKSQYKCGQCGQAFESQSELKRHEEDRHSRGSSNQERKNEPQRSQGAGSGSRNT